MRTGNLTTWLLRGTYPRLYVSIVAIILLVTGVRYHYLLTAEIDEALQHCLLYTSPSPRDKRQSRMPSSA